MTAPQFMGQRYLRLYPLYLVGISIGITFGLITLVLGHGKATVLEYALSAISGLMLLPSPTWHYNPNFMPLNYPAWPLVYEIGINIVFAWAWRWLNSKTLTIIVAISAVTLAALYFMGDPRGGPLWTTAWMGIPRVTFGFFAGVLIGRHYQPAIVTTPRAWAIPLLLVPMLYLIPNPASNSFTFAGKVIDAAFVLIACPIIILFGARFEPRITKLMALLGLISYPIYVVHEPVLDLCWRVLIAMHQSPERIAPIGGFIFVPVVVYVAWGLAKADERFRRIISRRMAQQSTVSNAPDLDLRITGLR